MRFAQIIFYYNNILFLRYCIWISMALFYQFVRRVYEIRVEIDSSCLSRNWSDDCTLKWRRDRLAWIFFLLLRSWIKWSKYWFQISSLLFYWRRYLEICLAFLLRLLLTLWVLLLNKILHLRHLPCRSLQRLRNQLLCVLNRSFHFELLSIKLRLFFRSPNFFSDFLLVSLHSRDRWVRSSMLNKLFVGIFFWYHSRHST